MLVDHSAVEMSAHPGVFIPIKDHSFAHDLASALDGALDHQGVANEIRVMDPTLDRAEYLPLITAYAANAVLVVTATRGDWFPCRFFGCGYRALFYDCSLYGPEFGRRLWQAEVSNSGGTGMMKERFRKMAESILQELRRAGVI